MVNDASDSHHARRVLHKWFAPAPRFGHRQTFSARQPESGLPRDTARYDKTFGDRDGGGKDRRTGRRLGPRGSVQRAQRLEHIDRRVKLAPSCSMTWILPPQLRDMLAEHALDCADSRTSAKRDSAQDLADLFDGEAAGAQVSTRRSFPSRPH